MVKGTDRPAMTIAVDLGRKATTQTKQNKHISFTSRRIFITHWSNVHLSEMACRTHDSAAQTHGQGHS